MQQERTICMQNLLIRKSVAEKTSDFIIAYYHNALAFF